jgi:hypothetical protein
MNQTEDKFDNKNMIKIIQYLFLNEKNQYSKNKNDSNKDDLYLELLNSWKI